MNGVNHKECPIVVLLDAGHGSDTAGKRSPIWSDGTQLSEWKFNREIQGQIIGLLNKSKISYEIISPEVKDIGLKERIRRANCLVKEYTQPCLYISLHGNAAGVESACGFEIFTSPGETKSDKCATIIYNEVAEWELFSNLRADMSDGDPDKEERFAVLTKTNCAAVLVESGFYTNEKECKKMQSELFQKSLAMAIVESIKTIINEEVLV